MGILHNYVNRGSVKKCLERYKPFSQILKSSSMKKWYLQRIWWSEIPEWLSLMHKILKNHWTLKNCMRFMKTKRSRLNHKLLKERYRSVTVYLSRTFSKKIAFYLPKNLLNKNLIKRILFLNKTPWRNQGHNHRVLKKSKWLNSTIKKQNKHY